ncbi:MAG: hypothetical protein ACYS0C_01630 [Planctomycetota bacterium]|jgi:hypothetical protein
MAKAKMPHPGHGKHLCYLNNLGFQLSNPKEYKSLVKNGKFLCKVCGRVAGRQGSLCRPAKL